MQSKIMMKEVRIYLENRLPSNTQLSFQISVGTTTIFRFDQLAWNHFCKRWEYTDSISLDTSNGQILRIQILKVKGLSSYKLLAQGKIQLLSIPQVLSEEIKICLTTNGQVVGWLYCELYRGQKIQNNQHYLNIHKLTTTFLDMRDEDCSIGIYLNSQLIYFREIHLKMRKKTLFPNLKKVVKKSDLLILQIGSKRQRGTYNVFLIDYLQSGETAFLKAWVRNRLNNKMGEFQIQYFLQNFYMPNHLLVFSKKQIQKIEKNRGEETLTKKQREDLRISVNIEQFADTQFLNNVKDENILLRRVIRGEKKRRKNLMLPSTSGIKVNKRTSLQMYQIFNNNSSLDI